MHLLEDHLLREWVDFHREEYRDMVLRLDHQDMVLMVGHQGMFNTQEYQEAHQDTGQQDKDNQELFVHHHQKVNYKEVLQAKYQWDNLVRQCLVEVHNNKSIKFIQNLWEKHR